MKPVFLLLPLILIIPIHAANAYTLAITDTHEFSSGVVTTDLSIVHIADNVFAIAWTQLPSIDGQITTFSITDGEIEEIETLEHDTGTIRNNKLIHAVDDIYLLAYTRSDNRNNFIKSFSITPDGSITYIDQMGNNSSPPSETSVA